MRRTTDTIWLDADDYRILSTENYQTFHIPACEFDRERLVELANAIADALRTIDKLLADTGRTNSGHAE